MKLSLEGDPGLLEGERGGVNSILGVAGRERERRALAGCMNMSIRGRWGRVTPHTLQTCHRVMSGVPPGRLKVSHCSSGVMPPVLGGSPPRASFARVMSLPPSLPNALLCLFE